VNKNIIHTDVQHDFHIGWCSCHLTVTRCVPLVEKELLTHLQHLCSPPVFYTPTRREGAILKSTYPSVRPSVCPSVHTFVKDVSAATGRKDFIFDTWLWHSDLYRVSPFQVYRTFTSCLPCDLEFFMFDIMKTFVTDISASTGRKDFIFDMWLWHGDLYRVSPFQVYCTSTSCLPCDLEFFMLAVMKFFVTDISASTGRSDFIFDIWRWHGDLYRVSPFQVYRTFTSCLPCDLNFLVMSVEIYTNLTQMNRWGYS
jgi:hypothetical protein